MRAVLLLVALALGACAPCEELCRAEASAYAQCLDQWGLEWRDLDAQDRASFRTQCVERADRLIDGLDDEAASAEVDHCDAALIELRAATTCDARWAALVHYGS